MMQMEQRTNKKKNMNNSKTMENSLFRRLKYLVLLQAGEKFRGIKTGIKKQSVFRTFLKVLIAVAVTAVLFFIFNYVKTKFAFSFDKELFTTVIFFTQIISIVVCVGSMMDVLYNSNENLILMAFPCNYNEIFISKIIVFTIEEIKKSCFFILPFLFSYGLVSGAGIPYWAQLIPLWLFVVLFPVLFSAIISIPCIFIKKFLENHSVWFGILVVLFLGGLFALVTYLLSKLPTPIKLVAIYSTFMNAFRALLVKINKFSLFYVFLGETMFGQRVYINIPILLGIFVLSILLCFFVAMPFYFKAASSSAEHSTSGKHIVRKTRFNNLFMTFFRKELKLMLRSSKSLNSALSIILVFPIISYIMNFIVAAVKTNLYGDYMTIAFNLMITLSLLSTYNANCASAISQEGSEFAILKAAPSNTMIATWAKLGLTMVVDLLAVATMCLVIGFTTNLPPKDIVLMSIIIIPISMGSILWSFQIDITNPKINDYAVKGDAVVDNPNIAKALVIGFLISTLIGVLSLLLLIDDYASGWARIYVIGYGYFLARLYLYQSNLKVYFNDIQG